MDLDTLSNKLDSEFYLQWPPGFVYLAYPNYYYKLQKVVFGLKQSHRVWYETLTYFMKRFDFQIGVLDPNLFRKTNGKHLMLVQIYVDDIIFESTDLKRIANFAKLMASRFQWAWIMS